MNVPILGIVENMSYFKLSRLRRYPSYFWGKPIEAIAAKHNIPVVCKLPIDLRLQQMRQRCSRGIRRRMAGSYGRFSGKNEIIKTGERIK